MSNYTPIDSCFCPRCNKNPDKVAVSISLCRDCKQQEREKNIRWCVTCEQDKEVTEFYSSKRHKRHMCKKCHYATYRQSYEYQRDAMLYRKYGISQEDYEAMFARQMGVCAICGRPETHIQKNGRVNALHIDHCHSSGVVRELLCNHCNTMLGSANDSIEVLQRAIAYLKKHST